MKKTLFLLLSVLISTAASAQMTGRNSSERTISSTQITNRTKSVTYQDTIVTSAYDDANQASYFYRTQPGTTSVLTAKISGIKVKDFCIYKDILYFCGQGMSQTLNGAILGWVSVYDLFYGSTNINVQQFQYATTGFKISVYDSNDDIHVSMLAVTQYNTYYYLIDYPMSSTVANYDIIATSSEYFTDLTQTDNFIVASGDSLDNTHFSLLRYPKGNIAGNAEKTYQFALGFSPFAQMPIGLCDSTSYIITNEANTDNIFFTATIQNNDSSEPYTCHIDVSTFNPICNTGDKFGVIQSGNNSYQPHQLPKNIIQMCCSDAATQYTIKCQH